MKFILLSVVLVSIISQEGVWAGCSCKTIRTCDVDCSSIDGSCSAEELPENSPVAGCQYYYRTDQKNLDSAGKACVAEGKVLATFTTDERRIWLNDYVKRHMKTKGQVWTKAQWTNPTDNHWTFGGKWGYVAPEFWNAGQPNLGGGKYGCTSLTASTGLLSALSCWDHTLEYVCMDPSC